MKREVVWTWASEADTQEMFMRLEEASENGGLRFVTTIERLVELLQSFPYLAPTWHSPIRRAVVRRFQCGIF